MAHDQFFGEKLVVEAYGVRKLTDEDGTRLEEAAKTFAELFNKVNDPQWFDSAWTRLVEDAGIEG